MTTGDAVQGQAPVRDISALSVWIVCGLLYAALIALVFTIPRSTLEGELGIMENGQNLILLAALIMMIAMAVRADTPLLRYWMIFVSLGTFYLLGEEISWGQHYFGWDVGGVFAEINDQGETNFHNTDGGWLDQKPRALLLLGMILGAVVHPLVKWLRKGRGLFDKPWWLAPTLASLAPVVFSQLAAAPKRIEKLAALPYSLDLVRWSEMEEVFMYAFFVAYMLSLTYRFNARKRAGVAPAG